MKVAILSIDPSMFLVSGTLWIFMLIAAVVCLVSAYRTKDKIKVVIGKDVNWVRLTAQAVGEVDMYEGKATVIRYMVGNVTYEKEVCCTEHKEIDIFYNKANPSKIIPAGLENKFRRQWVSLIVTAVILILAAFAQLTAVSYLYGQAMQNMCPTDESSFASMFIQNNLI